MEFNFIYIVLNKIGCQALTSGSSKGLGLSTGLKSGVLFSTYSTLVSDGGRTGSRLQQIVKWCGGADFDGCLIFDEAHKAKNFVADKDGQVSSCNCDCVLFIIISS
jgi:hypothetical protein